MGNSTGFPHFGQSTSCPVPATVERNVYLPSAASPRSQSTTTTECIVKRYFLLDMGLWAGYGRRVNHELRREPASRARFRHRHIHDGRRIRKNMCFCETNPPFSEGFFDAIFM